MNVTFAYDTNECYIGEELKSCLLTLCHIFELGMMLLLI